MKIIHALSHFTFMLLTASVVILASALFITTRSQPLAGIHSYSILTGSMSPLFPVGNVVFTHPQAVYELGDVIAFKRESKVITHRVISYKTLDGKRMYTVKGDANNVADSDQVRSDDVIGAVFFSLPFLGRMISVLHTPLGAVISIGIPAVLLILHEVWTIKTEFEVIVEKKVRKKLQHEVNQTIRGYLQMSHTTGG